MKIDRAETHDRLTHFKQDQEANIFQGAEDCLKKGSLSLALQEHSDYIYMFAHPRTGDDGYTKRMIWQPRLTKPEAQTNSYLFRAKSKSDEIEVCWLLPPREQWNTFKKGNLMENELVNWSVHMFLEKKAELEKPHPDDLPDSKVRKILMSICQDKTHKKFKNPIIQNPNLKI